MIDIKNLTVSYADATVAIKDLSLQIDDGDSIALIGGNGAGKTSLMLAIVGILSADSGSITVADVEVNKKNLETIRKWVGLVFQNPDDQLFMPRTYDDIAFGPRGYGHSEDEIAEKVGMALKLLNIEHLKDKSSLKLSYGERRSVAIASIMVMNPRIIMFDEPTAFLDPKARRNLINKLKDFPQTKIIATHDINFARETCNRAVILENGTSIKEGTAEELLSDIHLLE